MLAPCNVTLVDPVAAPFPFRITLIMPASSDSPWLKLPYLPPVVRVTCRVPATPCPVWHRTDVSASHVVRSHILLPSLVMPEYDVSPRFDPCTLKLADPVAAQLVRLDKLTMLSSTENPRLKLPPRRPVVMTTRWLPIAMCCSWHRSDVSDSQDVRSDAVTPILVEAVYAASPRLAPCRVTLDEPVPARFALR